MLPTNSCTRNLIEKSIKENLDIKKIEILSKEYEPTKKNSILNSYSLFNKSSLQTGTKYTRKYEYVNNVFDYEEVIEEMKELINSEEIDIISGISISEDYLDYVELTDEEELSNKENYNYFLIDNNGVLTKVINNPEDRVIKYINNEEGILNDILKGG